MTWRRDILRLLAVVNRRRREDVSLAVLARLAHRSAYNLHRRFRAVVGETPKVYTSRVRLSWAAAELVTTDRPVSAIAAECGFAGHEVFTRAFTRRFGMSPRRYRARGLHVAGDRAARAHAGVVASVAPCVTLYRMTVVERSTDMPVEISVRDEPEVHALVMRRRVAREEIAEALGTMLPALFAYAQSNGLAMSGPPFARYPEVGMGSLVMEGGIQLAAPATGVSTEDIEALTIPAGPAAVTIHHGPYDTLQTTYGAVEAWLTEEDRKPGGPPREVYLTDPGERPDPETWETLVVQPLVS